MQLRPRPEPVEGRAAGSKRASTSSARGCRTGHARAAPPAAIRKYFGSAVSPGAACDVLAGEDAPPIDHFVAIAFLWSTRVTGALRRWRGWRHHGGRRAHI